MKLIVGLGNIGKEYDNTFHNVGFYVVDAFVREYEFPEFKKAKNSLFTKKTVNGEQIVICKPTTYMNLSGKAVLELMQKFKINPKDIILVFDDFDMPLGKLRLKESGSGGTHNGVKDVVNSIGQDFKRIKIGTAPIDGIKPNDLAEYVLRKLNKEEQKVIDDSLNGAIKKLNECVF